MMNSFANAGEGLSDQEKRIEMKERDYLYNALFRELFAENMSREIQRACRRIITTGVRLNAEERLLLKMCYQDGLSVARAGEILGYNRNQVHGRMRRLLARLRREFEAMGVDEELLLFLKDG